MGAINDGGPAFPRTLIVAEAAQTLAFGMSLRDYFAGQALSGICACGTMTHDPARAAENARAAYAMADAMLAEREKPGASPC